MANVWSGADPSAAVDTDDYELASVVQALDAVTLTGIRVHSPANAVDRVGREGHVWDMTGNLLATITMTTALAPGWTTHLLDVSISLDAGDFIVIGFETAGNYSATALAFQDTVVSADGAMCFPQSPAVGGAGAVAQANGRFNGTMGTFPNQGSSTWYGIDAEYTAVGGSAPTITGLTLTGTGLDVVATITATDPDSLVGATYAIEWGDGDNDSGAGTSFNHTYATPGLKAILARVTDSTSQTDHHAGAVELSDPGAGLGVTGVLNAIVSHALASGLFESVNTHEPKGNPGSGVRAAVWSQEIMPVRSSGLGSTSSRIAFTLRIFSDMLQEPQDAIDPHIVQAVDTLMAAYSTDFQLGGNVRHVDLLGAHGAPLAAKAGYVQIDKSLKRIMDITLPLVVNDCWNQVA